MHAAASAGHANCLVQILNWSPHGDAEKDTATGDGTKATPTFFLAVSTQTFHSPVPPQRTKHTVWHFLLFGPMYTTLIAACSDAVPDSRRLTWDLFTPSAPLHLAVTGDYVHCESLLLDHAVIRKDCFFKYGNLDIFWTISHVFFSYMPPRMRRVTCFTE